MRRFKIPFSHTSYNIINELGKNIIQKAQKLSYNQILNSCDIGLSTVMIELKFLKNLN